MFHPDERLYSLLLVDPDVPDEASSSFATLAHWLVYVPPHPRSACPRARSLFHPLT